MPVPRRVLITAGPTHEPIDVVRFVSNRSSGRMGLALVEAALSRGHHVTLLLGPVSPDSPGAPGGPGAPVSGRHGRDSHLAVERFRTTEDLRRLLSHQWPRHDVLIMAAAVADYRPIVPPGQAAKVRSGRARWRIEMEPTPDLLTEAVAAARPDQTIIAFALEPAEGLIEAARRKLSAKGAHAIVANPLETMESDNVAATLILRDGRALVPPRSPCSKREFAEWLMEKIHQE